MPEKDQEQENPRPVRLRDPHDIFILPSEDGGMECSFKRARWPNECQVAKKTLSRHSD